MEKAIEKFDFRKMVRSLIEILVSDAAIATYHVIVFAIMLVFAIINGNNTFVLGIVAAIVYFAFIKWLDADILTLHRDCWLDRYINNHQYQCYIAPIIVMLLISSCIILMPPTPNGLANDHSSNHVAVIERGNDIRSVVRPWHAGFFVPGFQKVRWSSLKQEIEASSILKTKDGKTIQGTTRATIQFVESDDSILRNHQKYDTRQRLRGAIENDMNTALQKILLRYELTSLPPQIVIEDLSGTEVDFKKFEIKSITFQLTNTHRYFEVE